MTTRSSRVGIDPNDKQFETDESAIQSQRTREALQRAVHYATEYLDGKGRYRNRAEFPTPIVLLTDLKMPRMNGMELLAWVREHDTFHNLPVIVITGSSQNEDLRQAMNLGADSYVVKDLLMRPPPALFEAIHRLSSPPQVNVRDVWAHKATKLRT